MSKSIIIVGAGPGGLAAALLLARSGARVRVVERRSQVGGRTSALEARGFRFDVGPTFFLYPQILEEIFAAAGHDLHREVELVRLDPQYRVVFGAGGHLDATPDVARMKREIARLSPADALHLERYLADNRRKFELFRPILGAPANGWRDLLRQPWHRLLSQVRPWQSVDADLRAYFSDPRVRLAFSFQSKYLGMSPFRCPSLFTILAFLEYEYGVHHPIGGCAAVSEAMARVARRLGVEILLDEPVEELLFDGRRAVGVRTRSGVQRADAFVLNADFARAMQRLVPDRLRRRWTDRKIERKRFSCSTFMLYLGLEGALPRLAHHTIYVSADYRENLRDIEERRVLSADPSFYVQNAAVTDATLAPPGHSTLYVLVPVPHERGGLDWQSARTPFRARVLAQLQKIGIDDVEGRIRFERVLTPADWDRGFEIHRGATFSLAHDLGQILHNRPRNRFEDLDGVYLVGGGTHPGSGLPVIYESARITSRLLSEDLGLALPGGGDPLLRPLPAAIAEVA